MPGRRELLALGAVGVAAAVAGALVGPLALQPTPGTARLMSARFPDAAGRPHQLNEWLGRPTVFNFWATWCVPCREEVPLLVDFHRKYQSKGVEVVGICADQVVKMLEFSSSYAIKYPLLVADSSVFDLLRSVGNPAGALPYSLIIDKKGSIAHTKLGALRPGELERVVDPLFG